MKKMQDVALVVMLTAGLTAGFLAAKLLQRVKESLGAVATYS